ncbi:MAG: PRC-barrel domain-containing protein [bacterium]
MYKTIKILIGLSSVFCLVLLGGSVFAQGCNEFQDATVGAIYQPMGLDTFEASWLIGHRVTTMDNGELGQISSLVIDKTNDRIALVVLSDVPNLGAEPLAIPYSSVVRIGQETFEFNPGDMEIGVATSALSDPYIRTVTQYPSYSHFYGLPSVMNAAWLTDIYRHYGRVPYWTEEGEQMPEALELYESNGLMGADVRLPDGEEAGRINDFVIDSSDDRIAFLVLYDVPGRESSLIAVPFSTLSIRGENGFVLNTTRERLALSFDFDASGDLNNPRWAGDTYRYFGVQPYWTEQEEMAPSSSGPETIRLERNSLDWYQMFGY